MNPRIVTALTLVAVFALGAVVLAARGSGDGDREAPGFAGALMPDGVRAPDFSLRDQDGKRVTMRGFRGTPVLVTFLYTHCRETCPLQAQTARGALDDLGHDVPAIAVAVDPPNDTPDSARRFLVKARAIGRLDFLLGTRRQLAPVWKGFAVRPQSVSEEHQGRFTLVDKRGYQRVGFPLDQATPERIAHDLRLLERE